MDYIEQNIPDYKKDFFDRLGDYLNTKIYYYGSIHRYDNFSESDIDIEVFTMNEYETLNKICRFLNFDIDDAKEFMWKLHINNDIIHGYKLLYHDCKNDFYVDISIFNEKNKNNILNDQKITDNINIFYIMLLIILKFFYYKIQIIDWATYSHIKKKIIGLAIGGDKSEFIIIGEDENKRVLPFNKIWNFLHL